MPGHEYPIPWVPAQKNLLPVGIVPGTPRTEVTLTNHLASRTGNVSSEIFQRKLLQVLGDLRGVIVVADDIVIHGPTQADHDENLRAFLQRCQEVGIRLNKSKYETSMTSINFLGHRISLKGLEADPEKARAIENLPAPTDRTGIRRFLGLVNYVAKFVPNLADTVEPLQNLLKQDVNFVWSEAQQQAFDEVKNRIMSRPALAFFDPNKPIIVQNDASDYGLGSVLLQDDRPIAYASRSLRPAERNYAQIEKEVLAAVFGLEKFHHYTYGAPEVTVITDHKPLVSIISKPLSKAPRRLQSMIMQLQPYSMTMQYRPGPELTIADTLS